MLALSVMKAVIAPEEINNSGQGGVPDGENKPKALTGHGRSYKAPQ